MTIEEAIFCEKSYMGETNCINCKYYDTDTCLSRESHKMSIKALEQESILDKIKEEIIDKSYLSYDDNPRHIIDESWVLEIIDKYKVESESKR